MNANNAVLPEELRDITLNCRYVYVPPFQVPDKERKFGNLTLTYATQIHACVVEIDQETGAYEIVDYAAVDDCGIRIHPQIVEGQVHGATAHAIGAATHEHFPYDEEGNLLTPNFYDYHVPHALDMPPLKTGYVESPSPFTPLGAKGMGEGGGAGLSAVCAALQDALRPVGGPIVYDSCNPYRRVWELMSDPARARGVSVEAREGLGRARVRRPAPGRLGRAQRPGADGADDAGGRSFDVQDDRHWSANVAVPLGLGSLKMSIQFEKMEERPPEYAQLNAKGKGVGAMITMETQFELCRRRDGGTDMNWEADVSDRRAGRRDGPARAPADREPAGQERARRARQAGAAGRGRRRHLMSVKTIVAGYDGSEEAGQALDRAVEYAKAFGAQLVVVAVGELPAYVPPYGADHDRGPARQRSRTPPRRSSIPRRSPRACWAVPAPASATSEPTS